MNTLFVYFDSEGNPIKASLRVNNQKVQDTDLWELWDFYQLLLAMGAQPIRMTAMDGNPLHVVTY